MASVAIQVLDVTKIFSGRTVLDAIRLDVMEGETLVILGGSGSGKSTLLRLMIGNEKCNGGDVMGLGKSLSRMSADELADELGRRFGLEREEVRTAISDVIESWRREAGRVSEGTGSTAARIAADLGVASRTALDELELRVAQLEHRLKLLERGPRS